ncbi:MAG: TldD/PmbA family protein, partial [Erysipelotrichaceae bacterium]|nr:TldD/PmbA family protein [Erysipelotrichaceae bacterium]
MLDSFLKSRIETAKKLVEVLSKEFEYVSVLGSKTNLKRISINSKNTGISNSDIECGFVIKIYSNGSYFEYSVDDIEGLDLDKVREAARLDDIKADKVSASLLKEEEMTASFVRDDDEPLTNEQIIETLNGFRQRIMNYDERIFEAQCAFTKRDVSKIFVSAKKCLDQQFTWCNAVGVALSREGNNIKNGYDSGYAVTSKGAIDDLEGKLDHIAELSTLLLKSKPIVPGTYTIITDPSITGLIAHEAFGHGVEMDMFVKNRAKAKDYVGKYVASPIVNMRDGAGKVVSSGSYFFDDNGVIANETLIIENGILKAGISDALSAMELKQTPTGNGRRESFKRKAYTRMTNTYFEAGKDKYEDMIASVKYGYLLCDTNNGMEDPKNWQIQCTASYG